MFYINVRLTTGNRKGCLASRPGAAPGTTHVRSGLPQASCEALGAGILTRGRGGEGGGEGSRHAPSSCRPPPPPFEPSPPHRCSAAPLPRPSAAPPRRPAVQPPEPPCVVISPTPNYTYSVWSSCVTRACGSTKQSAAAGKLPAAV